jgi:hypothetical protein
VSRVGDGPRHPLDQRGLDGVGAKEVATTTRAKRVVENNDNCGGGDDNYPRRLTVMGVEGPTEEVAGAGRNSCR